MTTRTSAFRGLVRAWPLPLLLLAAPAGADPLFPLPLGQDVTLGGSSNPRTVQTAGHNPAAPVTSDLGAYWFGLGGVSAGYEVADFNNLIERFEQLEQDLGDEDLTQAEAEQLAQDAGAFLTQLSNQGYVKAFASAQPPLLPTGGAMPFLGGAFTFGVRAMGGARISFLGDDVRAVNSGTSTPCNTDDCEITSNIAGYGKGAAGAVVSLGYSGGVHHREDGSLFVGGRLNYYTIELSRAVVKLEDDADGDGDETSDDTEDGIEDEFDRNRVRSTELGLDLGLLWAARNFRAGATLRNVNEPEFAYGALGQNCASLPADTPQRDNCETAAEFNAADPARVPLTEVYRIDRQLQLEAAVYTATRTWSLAATYDADPVRDATGDEYQWLGVSGAFSPGGWGWLAPALRVGYRQNQAGSELDMLSLGLSLFRLINLDVSASTQEVEHDGDKGPRSAMASLSLELYF